MDGHSERSPNYCVHFFLQGFSYSISRWREIRTHIIGAVDRKSRRPGATIFFFFGQGFIKEKRLAARRRPVHPC